MKNSLKENPDIIPIPQIKPVTIPQTNPVKTDLPEIVPEIKKEEPLPIVPEIQPFQPERAPQKK
ncbi:MAG: hypothetical protein H0U95_16665 [Bacteroidetes bacterium]|nr:hypothetical protein [Bacteroidota bacterium]